MDRCRWRVYMRLEEIVGTRYVRKREREKKRKDERERERERRKG